MDDYITKPINPREFFDVLERTLQPKEDCVSVCRIADTNEVSNSSGV